MPFKSIFPALFFSVLVCVWLPPSTGCATDGVTDVAPSFEQGVAAFQKSDFTRAAKIFGETLQAEENNVAVLFDLGLTEQKAGNPGLALALWRKALTVSPGFSQARRAIDGTSSRLEHAELPHEVEIWESLHANVFSRFPLDLFLALTAASLAIGGWLLLAYFGARRRARLEESAMPGFPMLATFTLLVGLVTVLLSAGKAADEETLRATIVTKKVSALSSPDEKATPLFDLYEGLEVIVRDTHENWVQVNYPGGSTGWIPKATLFSVKDSAATFIALTKPSG